MTTVTIIREVEIEVDVRYIPAVRATHMQPPEPAEVEILDVSGIHTCHSECQQSNCVLRRELATVTEQRDELIGDMKEIYNISSFDYDTMPEAARRLYHGIVLEIADKARKSTNKSEL
jgi:hypothetical protein